MKKIIIAVFIIIFLFVTYKLLSNKPLSGVSDDQAQLILFHGDGCPHCKLVLDYINANKANETIKISYHEVYYSKTNQNLLAETVKKCPEIDSAKGIGVPLAFDKDASRCLYGDTPIIDWIKSKMLK